MRGGAPGPNGWQVLWAGAGHGFLIQSRTQEWRQGEFAVGKLNLLNISFKSFKNFATSISCGWRRGGDQASPWVPSPSTPSWVGTGELTACKFWSTTSPTSLLLTGITWQAPPLHQESNMSTRCLKPPPQPPPPLVSPAFTKTVSGPPPL